MPDLEFKRLLTPARAPDGLYFRTDYTLNLYRGCNHGCIYCDSRSVCYHMEDFDRVRVKRDCLPALEAELRAKKQPGVVGMGAASDPYNALESRLQVTRGSILLLQRYGVGVALATKAARIARDADLLAAIGRKAYACAAFSITTADAGLAAFLEPHAPPPAARFAAMRTLAQAGVVTGVWMNPMLPFLTDNTDTIRAVLKQTAAAGGRFALCHFGVTLREGDREYFYQALERDDRFAPLRAQYTQAFGLSYLCASPQAAALSAFFTAECDRLGLAHDFATVNRLAAEGVPVQLRLW
jgi:DNA repair photolyase